MLFLMSVNRIPVRLSGNPRHLCNPIRLTANGMEAKNSNSPGGVPVKEVINDT